MRVPYHAPRARFEAQRRKSILESLRGPRAQTLVAVRAHNASNMGLFEADTSPYAFDPSSGPMSSFFAAIPNALDAAVPTNTLKRDTLAWKR